MIMAAHLTLPKVRDVLAWRTRQTGRERFQRKSNKARNLHQSRSVTLLPFNV